MEHLGGGECADEPRVGGRRANTVVDVLGVAANRDAGGAGSAVDGVERLHDVDEGLERNENFIGGRGVRSKSAGTVCVERTQQSTAVESGPPAAETGDEVALAGRPKLGQPRLDGSCLAGVPGTGTGVSKSVGKLGTFNKCAVLDHEGEEMDALDFFPEIKAGVLPDFGNVFQVGLDDGVGGELAVVEGGGDIGRLPGVQHQVCKLDENGGPDGGAIKLWATPALVEGISVDEEFGLANAAGGVGTAGVRGLLQLVVHGGVGLDQGLEGFVPADVAVEEDLEDHGRITSPLEVAAVGEMRQYRDTHLHKDGTY